MKIIITGASKGIGRGIAVELARHGHSLGLLARSKDVLAELSESIKQPGAPCYYAACDLRSPEATNTAIEELIAELGGIDALINNAGLVIRKDIFELPVDEWNAMIETNVNGLFYATRTVLPHLKQQGSGHIINISSISGRLPLPGGSGYAASKYAVTGFSESLFFEVRDHGIKVTTIFPGSVGSDSHSDGTETETSWKIRPEEVGAACQSVLATSPSNCISRVEIRPLRKPDCTQPKTRTT